MAFEKPFQDAVVGELHDLDQDVLEEKELFEDDGEEADSPFSLRPKLHLTWRNAEDADAIRRVKAVADEEVLPLFKDALALVDEFYEQLGTHRGDSLGQADWERLTGQDIEEFITRLLRARLPLSYRVNEMFLEAAYARRVASDIFDDAWGASDGTQGDRKAAANVSSREDRYHAYFRFYLYSSAKTLLDEINHLIRHLENVRYWRIRSQRG